MNAPCGDRLVATLAESSLFAAGRLVAQLAHQHLRFDQEPGSPLHPCLFHLTEVDVLPGDWSFADRQQRLIIGGIAISPFNFRQGRIPGVDPTETGHFRVDLPTGRRHSEPCFFVGGDPFGNYYHSLLDFFPRLRIFQELETKLPELRGMRMVLMRQRPPFVDEFLGQIGFPTSRLLEIEADRADHFENLFVVSNLSQFGHVHPLALRSLGAGTPPPAPARGRRLYISRRAAGTRRVLNEDEVAAAIVPLGFEVVRLERATLAEQQAMFGQAEMVVGPHGAGLVNLVWTPANCRLVELHPAGDWLHHFATLAKALRRPYTCVECPSLNGAHGDFVVDPRALCQALEC